MSDHDTKPAGLDLPRIERILREAVAQARARDYTIAPGRTLDQGAKRCCPMGALLLSIPCAAQSIHHARILMEELGDNFSGRAFAAGFDTPDVEYESDEAQLGARLRREWVPT